AIIETGTSGDADRILEAVRSFGLKPADIDAVVVSHIHLDHAGGAGFLLPEMPKAKVYVHERGLKHLVDPTRLVASAREALGSEEADIFGTMRAIPADRLVAVKDQQRLELGKHARVVRGKLASAGEDGVLRELYEMTVRAAKRYPRDFLERRIRVSITGLAAYHARMEHAARTG